MPPAEWPHRLAERRRRARDAAGDLAARAQDIPPSLQAGPFPRLPIAMDTLLSTLDDRQRAQLGAEVDLLLEDSGIELLGQARPAGSRRDYHLEPEGGGYWPSDEFAYAIDFTHAQAGRDIKLTWELMRLHTTQVLALGAALLRRSDAREAAWEDIRVFLSQNPPFDGVAWAGGIETSARLVSLLVVTGLLGEPPKDIRRPLLASLVAHQRWAARYLSLHSSANNHLVAELAGAFIGGCCLAGVALAGELERLASLLNRELCRQILPDGVGVEQSPTYQAYTMEWALLARQVGRKTGHPLPASIDVPLRAGASFLAALHDEGGHYPHIGDDDEGVVLRPSLAHEPDYVASICCVVAGLLDEPRATVAAHTPDLRAPLLGAPAPPTQQPSVSRTFPDGGYTLLVRGPTRLVFDHGELGHTIGAHGHADTLSVWLHHRGAPVVIDPGTYRYNGADAWRDHFRSTAAHPTLTLFGRSSSTPTGRFHWGARARVTQVDGDPAAGWVSATHDGYGVRHRRTVRLEDGALHVTDEVLGAHAGVPATLCWPLDPRLTVRRDGETHQLWQGDAHVGSLTVRGALEPALHRQATAPAPGVSSPRYNRLVAAPALLYVGTLAPGATVHSLFELP